MLSCTCSRTRHDGSVKSGSSSATACGSFRRAARSANWIRTTSSRSLSPARTSAGDGARGKERRSAQASCQRTVRSRSTVKACASRAPIAGASSASRQPERAAAARLRTMGSRSPATIAESGASSSPAPGVLALSARQAASTAATRTADAGSVRLRCKASLDMGVFPASRPYPYTARARTETSRAAVALCRGPAARASAVLPSAKAARPARFGSGDTSAAVSSSENVRALSSSTIRRYPGCSPGADSTGNASAAIARISAARPKRTGARTALRQTTSMGSLTLLR